MSGGQILGGVIGAAVGFFMPGGGTLMAARGMSLGMGIGGYLDPPRSPTINGPRLEDLTFQTSTYGSFIPRIYGTLTVSGNIFWLENNQLKEVARKNKSRGKGGGSSSSTRTYSYYATFALGLCEGPIVGVRRIWAGSKLIYDAGTNDNQGIIASNQTSQTFNLHLGNNTQSPDPRMQATLGLANTPAYRGLAYLVFKDFALANYQNSLQGVQLKVEIIKNGAASNYAVTLGNMPISGRWDTIASNGSMFCTLKMVSNIAMTSTDGLNWTQHPNLPFTQNWATLIHTGKSFVGLAMQSDKSVMSPNGINWYSGGLLPFAGSWTGAVWTGSFICAVCDGGSAVSANGSSWEGGPAPSGLYKVAWNGKMLLGVRNGFQQNALSTDGLNWTAGSMPLGSIYWLNIVGANGWFYTIAWDTNICAKSQDGVNWITGTMPNGPYWTSIKYANGLLYAVAHGSDVMAISNDGLNWTSYSMGTGGDASWKDIEFNGAVYALVVSSETRNGIVTPYKITSTAPTLGSIVQNECLLSGTLTTLDIDTDSLTRVVRGYKIASICAIKSSLIQLQGAFPFDVIQSGYKVKFKPRGSSSVVTIPASDLGAIGD